MAGSLREFASRQQFNPGVAGIFINPFFLARRALWREMALAAPHLQGRLLDVGCGRKPYRDLFKVDEYLGMEIDSEVTRARGYADVFYDGEVFPFDDGAFDAIVCNQVLEHVFNPDAFLEQIHRVLRPGGRLLLTVPFVWDEHEQPYDYARYSSFGLAHLLSKHGLHIETHRRTLSDFSIIAQLVNAYTFKCTRSRITLVNVLATAILMAPFSALGWALGKVLPANQDLFLDSVILAQRQ
jgi:SAM-dependent methyltransferase